MKVKELIEQLRHLDHELEVMTVHNHYSCGGDSTVDMVEPLTALVVGDIGVSVAYGITIVASDTHSLKNLKSAVLLR